MRGSRNETKEPSLRTAGEEKRRQLPILEADRRGAVGGPRAENSGGTQGMGREERKGRGKGRKRGNFLRVTNNRADSTDPRGAQSPR